MKPIKDLLQERKASQDKIDALNALAEKENRDLTAEEAKEYAAAEKRFDELTADIAKAQRNEQRQAVIAAQSVALESTQQGLTRGEERDFNRFDFGKALRCLAGMESLDGVEAEVQQEGVKEARASGLPSKGLLLPRSFCRRDMTATGTTSTTGDQGGMTVSTMKSGLLDDFYDNLVLRRAGATVLEGLTGNVDFPRYVAPSDPSNKAENGAAGELSPTTAMLQLSPNRLPAFVDISEQLLRQSSAAVETVVRRNLNSQILGMVENQCINGGGSNEPTGILQTSGIGAAYAGAAASDGTNADGASHVYTDWINVRKEVAVDNANSGSLAFLTNSLVEAQAMTTAKVSSTDSVMIWDAVKSLAPIFITNAVPSTIEKGSSGSTLSALIYGNFQDLYMGFWSGVSFELLRDSTNAKSGLYTLVLALYFDAGVVRPKSFAAIDDIDA